KSDRVTLWLSGEFSDLEVIALIEGSGTGRYGKSQSSTTAFGARDRGRELSPSGNASGVIASPLPSISGEPGTSRISDPGQSSANTSTYRREQHVKEQGPMYLVRLRARHILTAERQRHHLFGKPTPRGTYRSAP